MTTTSADAWQALLAAHARITERLDRDLNSETDMGLAEFEVLDHLSRAENLTIRMNELAALVRLSPSGLTRRFDTPCAARSGGSRGMRRRPTRDQRPTHLTRTLPPQRRCGRSPAWGWSDT
ncbi:MAG: hypothetical protein M5U19_01355 [Microthrixaceae bacterium]|nr:hypothetical protein [Microthrixaceae bacterium]